MTYNLTEEEKEYANELVIEIIKKHPDIIPESPIGIATTETIGGAVSKFLDSMKELELSKLGDKMSKVEIDKIKLAAKNLNILAKATKGLSWIGVLPALKEAIDTNSSAPINKYIRDSIITFGIASAIGLTAMSGIPAIVAVIGLSLIVSEFSDELWSEFLDGVDIIDNWLDEFEKALSEKGINIKEDGQCEIKLTPEIAQCLINEYTQSPIKEIQDVFHLAETTVSPLVIDLDRDGVVETVNIKDGTYFDHNNNGFSEKTGWVGRDDGILIRDINNNGDVDGGYEVFGDNTVLSNGEKAKNGFEALADLDSNGDGVFDSKDDAWNEVKVWQDKNGNGKIDNGEILTLEDAGVGGIDSNYSESSSVDENGNHHKQQGTFWDLDGNTHKVNDVWFEVDGSDTKYKLDIEIPKDISNLPNIEGFGSVYSLHEAMALDETGELKKLVTQYMVCESLSEKSNILNGIIYRWAGVYDIDPNGRGVLGGSSGLEDARKLEAIEEFLGEEYSKQDLKLRMFHIKQLQS